VALETADLLGRTLVRWPMYRTLRNHPRFAELVDRAAS
jgi:hypothetical protein